MNTITIGALIWLALVIFAAYHAYFSPKARADNHADYLKNPENYTKMTWGDVLFMVGGFLFLVLAGWGVSIGLAHSAPHAVGVLGGIGVCGFLRGLRIGVFAPLD